MAVRVPDVEGGLKAWLLTKTDVTDLVGARIGFGVDPRSAYPAVAIRLIGNIPETSEAPIYRRLVQIDVFDEGRQKTRCFAVCAAIEEALGSIRQATALGSDVVAWGADIQSTIYLPDPGGAPRYSITVEVTARSTAAV